jgi:hypothetical protein
MSSVVYLFATLGLLATIGIFANGRQLSSGGQSSRAQVAITLLLVAFIVGWVAFDYGFVASSHSQPASAEGTVSGSLGGWREVKDGEQRAAVLAAAGAGAGAKVFTRATPSANYKVQQAGSPEKLFTVSGASVVPA